MSTVSSSNRSFISTTTSTSRTTATSSSSVSHSADNGPLPWQQQQQLRSNNNNKTSLSGSSTPVEQPIDLYPPPVPRGYIPFEPAREPSDQEPVVPDDGSENKLQCPFCAEHDIITRIGRKPDLKRHFKHYHATNAQWVCKLNINDCCNLSFDCKAAYEVHIKKDHDGLRDPDAMANLCQQVVFACGFERCREVFEAQTDADGPRVKNHYFEHVLSHVTNTSSDDTWSYSRRLRNLLHQRTTHRAWRDRQKAGDGQQLLWQPQSSSILRAMLETRHIMDVPILCRYAVLLGSRRQSEAPAIPPSGFAIPVLNTCNVPCHDPHQDERFSRGASSKFQKSRVTHRRAAEDQHRPLPAQNRVLRSSPSVSTVSSASSFAHQPLHFYTAMYPQTSNPDVTSAPGFGLDAVTAAAPTSYPAGHHEPGAMTAIQSFAHSHPLDYYVAAGSLGTPPSPDQVIMDMDCGLSTQGMADHRSKTSSKRHVFSKLRQRRNSSPESDCHMGGYSPPPLPATLPAQHHASPAPPRDSSTYDFYTPSPT